METPTDNNIDSHFRPMICLYDKKSRLWPAPAVYNSAEMAKRELAHAAKYGKGVDGNPPMFVDYPDDFQLVQVGLYDTLTGTILPQHIVLCEVSDVLAKE